MDINDGIKRSSGFNFFNIFKKSREKEIEECASNLEKNAIKLINFYGPNMDLVLKEGALYKLDGWNGDGEYYTSFIDISAFFPYGGNHAKPKLISNGTGGFYKDGYEDSKEYIIMRDFLNKHQDYNTKNAKCVRKYYKLE